MGTSVSGNGARFYFLNKVAGYGWGFYILNGGNDWNENYNDWTSFRIEVDTTSIKCYVNNVLKSAKSAFSPNALNSNHIGVFVGLWNDGTGGQDEYIGYLRSLKYTEG